MDKNTDEREEKRNQGGKTKLEKEKNTEKRRQKAGRERDGGKLKRKKKTARGIYREDEGAEKGRRLRERREDLRGSGKRK